VIWLLREKLPHYLHGFVELPKALISDSDGKLSLVNVAYMIALVNLGEHGLIHCGDNIHMKIQFSGGGTA